MSLPTINVRLPGGSVVKNLPANAGAIGDVGSISVRKIPWRRKWQPTAVFLPGEFHGERSLAGYSSWRSTAAATDAVFITSMIADMSNSL